MPFSASVPNQITLTITGVAHDGSGVGKLPNPAGSPVVVFVPRAFPGQTIKCRIIHKERNFWQGTLLDVLAQEAQLNQPFCPQWHTCGGCLLQPMPYEDQLCWKENILRNALRRIGRLADEIIGAAWGDILPSPALQHFRNKITLAFGEKANTPIMGLRSPESHKVIPVNCALIDSGHVPIAQEVGQFAQQSGFPSEYWRFFTMRYGRTLDNPAPCWHVILLTSGGPYRRQIRQFAENLLGKFPDLHTFVHEERYKKDFIALGQTRVFSLGRTPSSMAMELGGKIFALDPANFFQVNGPASELLAQTAIDLTTTTKGKLLDLCCGVGAPGLLLPNHSDGLGIEASGTAIGWARANASRLGKQGWQYEAGTTAKKIKNLALSGGAFQTALIDPPRGGLEKDALRGLMQIAPRHILYISCNPATLARDAATLNTQYSLKSLRGIDMFPHTPHLESCSLWELRA